VALAHVAHVAEAAHPDVGLPDAGGAQEVPPPLLHLRERAVRRPPVELVEPAVEAADEVEGERAHRKPKAEVAPARAAL
jgi:hypothetical protein